MIVKQYCTQCNKQAMLSREYDIGPVHFVQYTCGHVAGRRPPAISDFSNFVSSDGHKPYKFQIEGAVFVLSGFGRALIADEMGLGKTIQALMIAESLKARLLILCKSGLKIQWAKENYRWRNGHLTQVLESENDFIMPNVNSFVLSFDMLWRFKDISAFIKKLNIDLLILDEVQHLKNSNTKRTNGVRAVAGAVKYCTALSGTPVENNMSEYFPILNMLRPDKFPEKKRFEMQFVQTYWNGYSMKYGGSKSYDKFKKYTEDFIIRRKRADVLPDLPNISRQFLFTELGDEVSKMYQEEVKQFQEFYNYGSIGMSNSQKQASILAYLAKMRHLTGIAKIEPVIEYIQDFIDTTDRKIVVFAHHIDVEQTLIKGLTDLGIKTLSICQVDPNLRQGIIEQFRDGDARVLVAGTLASGEGINLQFCADAIVMEREWNPSKEEQAEARFPRPGQTSDKINAVYPTAVGTVDEFLSELVEKKRQYCSSALDGSES